MDPQKRQARRNAPGKSNMRSGKTVGGWTVDQRRHREAERFKTRGMTNAPDPRLVPGHPGHFQRDVYDPNTTGLVQHNPYGDARRIAPDLQVAMNMPTPAAASTLAPPWQVNESLGLSEAMHTLMVGDASVTSHGKSPIAQMPNPLVLKNQRFNADGPTGPGSVGPMPAMPQESYSEMATPSAYGQAPMAPSLDLMMPAPYQTIGTPADGRLPKASSVKSGKGRPSTMPS